MGGHIRGEHALPRTEVEDLLAPFRAQEVKHGRDGRGLVVTAPALADPAVVPGGDRFPAASSGASTP